MTHRPRRLVVALFGVSCLGVGCQNSTEPVRSGGIPAGWAGVGTGVQSYIIAVDRRTVHGGSAALVVQGTDTSRLNFSGVGQPLRADNYRGKRVRFRAWVQQTAIVGSIAGLWMRIDGPGVLQGFDNFSTRPLLGSADWHRVEIILDVPDNAIGIIFGALMSGRGQLFVDDITFEVIPAEGPTTNMLVGETPGPDSTAAEATYRTRPTSPTNLGFEAR